MIDRKEQQASERAGQKDELNGTAQETPVSNPQEEELGSDEREEIWSEGHAAFDMGLEEHSNPYRPGSLEAEIWSDGWEDGYEDDQQLAKKRCR